MVRDGDIKYQNKMRHFHCKCGAKFSSDDEEALKDFQRMHNIQFKHQPTSEVSIDEQIENVKENIQ